MTAFKTSTQAPEGRVVARRGGAAAALRLIGPALDLAAGVSRRLAGSGGFWGPALA